MSIANLLSPRSVQCDSEARSKKHALEMLSQMLVDNAPSTVSQKVAFASLVARERLGSTVVDPGAAIPHGRVEGLEAATGAVLRLAHGVDFDTPDDEPVGLLFGMLVPQDCTDEHLTDLAAIATMLSDRSFRSALAEATDSASLHDLIVGYGAQEQSGNGPTPPADD